MSILSLTMTRTAQTWYHSRARASVLQAQQWLHNTDHISGAQDKLRALIPVGTESSWLPAFFTGPFKRLMLLLTHLLIYIPRDIKEEESLWDMTIPWPVSAYVHVNTPLFHWRRAKLNTFFMLAQCGGKHLCVDQSSVELILDWTHTGYFQLRNSHPSIILWSPNRLALFFSSARPRFVIQVKENGKGNSVYLVSVVWFFLNTVCDPRNYVVAFFYKPQKHKRITLSIFPKKLGWKFLHSYFMSGKKYQQEW